MQSSALPNAEVSVTLSVDTHKDAHVDVALDGIRRHRGTLSVPATITSYEGCSGGPEDSASSRKPGWRVRDPSARDSLALCVPRGRGL